MTETYADTTGENGEETHGIECRECGEVTWYVPFTAKPKYCICGRMFDIWEEKDKRVEKE